MKRTLAALALLALALFVTAGRPQGGGESDLDAVGRSPAARLELPDGTSAYVDSEMASLRSLAGLALVAAPLSPADQEGDWLYRIVFNPADRVENAREVTVSFHEHYVQINTEYYQTPQGVDYESVLQWAEAKFDYFLK